MKQEKIFEFRENLNEAFNVFFYINAMHDVPISHDDAGTVAQTASLIE